MTKTILIAGATGVVGHTALEYFAASGEWEAIAVSRRKPDCIDPFEHIAVDLTDEARCRDVFGGRADVSHVVYTALHEKQWKGPWPEPDPVGANLDMLRNLLEPLLASGGIEHVTLLQGTKAYGVHMREIPAPAKERWPRFEHENFYWAQEDYIRERQAGQQWHWTIFRPQIIFGYSIGSAMNLIPAIGALAAICREENRPMGFPGTSSSVLEAADARLLARAFEWAATADAGHDDTFNITNGDIFIWPNVWPAIAAALNVATEPGNAVSLRDLFRDKASVWDEIVRKHGLRPLRLHELVGRSDFYADMGFNFGADRSSPGLVSTIKIRQHGFGECLDTEDAFAYWLNRYIEQGVLPPVE